MGDGDFNHFLKMSSLILIVVVIMYIPFILKNPMAKNTIESIKSTLTSQESNQGDIISEDKPILEKIPDSGASSGETEDPPLDDGDNQGDNNNNDNNNNDNNNEDNNNNESGNNESENNESNNNESGNNESGNFGEDIFSIVTDFESGSLSEHWNAQFARSDSGIIVSDITRNGNYALKMNVRHGDVAVQHDAKYGKSRVELSLKLPYADEYPMDGRPVFYGWSVYFPTDFYFNSSVEHDGFNIVGQWFHRPEANQSWEEWERNHGGKKGSPSVSIRYEELADGTTGLGVLTRPNVNSQSTLIGERAIQLGEWNDIIFEVKWSMGNDGYIQAWLNGGSFTDGKYTARNMYTSTPKNLKLGLYRGPNVLSENTIYYDEIRIGGSYEEVDPSNY